MLAIAIPIVLAPAIAGVYDYISVGHATAAMLIDDTAYYFCIFGAAKFLDTLNNKKI